MTNYAMYMQYAIYQPRTCVILCLDHNTRKVFVKAVVCGAELSALPLCKLPYTGKEKYCISSFYYVIIRTKHHYSAANFCTYCQTLLLSSVFIFSSSLPNSSNESHHQRSTSW